MSLAEDIAPFDVDYVQMYKLVLSFKDTLSKLFSETGMAAESSQLRDFQTVSVEAHTEHCPSSQLLSSNVHLVFQLIVDLIQAILVSKGRESRGVQKEETATQTEDGTAVEPCVRRRRVTTTTDRAATVKQEEKGNENSDDHDPTLTPTTLHEPPLPPSIPLRKSRRTSVLNRKPFVTPRQTRRKNDSPSKEPVTAPTRAATKPSAKPPSHSKPHTRSSTQPAGAQKRKLGTVRKKSLLAKAGKKTDKEAAVSEETVKEEDEDEEEEEAEEVENRPRRGRRSVLATTMYERTAEGTFRCRECGKVAKLQTNIRKHLRKHTGEKPYRCTVCPVAFAYPRSLKRHQLVHEGVRPYQCPECSKRFFDPTSLRTHSRVHTNDRPFVCQVCGDRFRQKEGLKGHMRRHTGDRPYVCEHCGMAFAAKRSLTRHIRVHTGERPYSCDQCVAAFADWTTLHNHKLVHRSPPGIGGEGDGEGQDDKGHDPKEGRGSESRPFQCQFCGIRYRQPLSLKRHIRLHSANPAPPKKKPPPVKRRPEDGRGGGLAGEVGAEEEPIVALHLHYRPYACDLCGAKFKHLRGYETHKGKHESGTLTAKKKIGPAKRLKQEGEISPVDIQQAASILASVAVNSDSDAVVAATTTAEIFGNAALTNSLAAHHHHHHHHHEATMSPLPPLPPLPPPTARIALSTESSNSSSNVGNIILAGPHHTTHTISLPHSTPLPHTITIAHNTAAAHHHGGGITTTTIPPPSSSPSNNNHNPLSMSLLPSLPSAQQQQQPEASTVTIIDATAAFNAMGTEATGLRLPVSGAAAILGGEPGEMIQYAPGGNVTTTQVLQYPDGTLSEVTTLVPHHPHHPPIPPSSSILPATVDLLDNVVTVVFETRDGNVVLENQ